LSPTYPVLLAARMVMGLGGSMFLLTTHIWLARLSTPENRARLFSFHQVAGIVGMSLGPAISGAVAGWLSWRYSVLVTIGAAVFAAVAAPRLPLPASHADSASGAAADPPPRIPAREVWGIGFCNLAFNISFGGIVFTLVPLFAANALQMGPAAIGAILMAGTAQRFGSALVGGSVATRLGTRSVVFISLFGLGTAVLAFLFVGSPVGLLVALSLVSWANLGGSFVIAMITDRSPPSAWGHMFGMNRVFGDAGSMIAPVLVGWIVDQLGFSAAFAAMSLLILASAAAGAVLTSSPPPVAAGGRSRAGEAPNVSA
jgi:predicted MFS family arabinose efflux permease